MAFPSLPLQFADPPPPPPNWNLQSGGGGGVAVVDSGGRNNGAGSGGAASFRAGSTAERARLAKIINPPADQHALKCPRCDSTNTKFCYYNNYSLSQPRHFCKACRRYWTRGGALRNVPVGGGCRRNKRAKSGAAAGGRRDSAKSAGGSQRTGAGVSSSAAAGGAIMTSGASPPMPDYGNVGMRIRQQFPMMLGGMEPLLAAPPSLLAPFPSSLYSSFGEGTMEDDLEDRGKEVLKMDENAQDQVQLGVPRLYLGDNSKNNDMFWGGGAAGSGGSSSSGWAATGYLSSFNSSSSADHNNFM